MIGLDKCTGSCDILSSKICLLKETKDIKAKTIAKHISCDIKSKFNSTTCNSNQNHNNKICQCEFKNYRRCKKDYSWNPSTCICENRKYLKSIEDTSAIKSDEIITVADILSTKMTNTIATNGTSTASINYHSKIVRDSYILHTVLLIIILLLIITIICYHYVKNKK